MAVSDRENIRRLALALLTGVAVCALVSPAVVARAQDAQPAASLTTDIPEDAKLLLAANELLYDRDAERVTAVVVADNAWCIASLARPMRSGPEFSRAF